MPRLSVQLLGPFHASLDGEPITGFESNKVRALLAYLAVECDRAHSRQKVAGMLWPDRAERKARQNLSQALSNLRRVIGDRDTSPPFLNITSQSLGTNPDSDHWLDVAAFEELLVDCQAHEHGELLSCDLCVDSLQEALALCRGPFLEGFSFPDSGPFEEWALLEGERLRRLEVQGLRSAAACLAERGEHDGAVEYLERWTQLEPWDEAGHRQLMRVFSASGRRSAALRQYEECVRTLEEELGLAPSDQTRALYEEILAQTGEPASLPSPPARARPSLPPQAIPFVGRETMLADIQECLGDPACRMLTLVGPGGSGKTRLAIETAERLEGSYAHGVYFVPLAGVASGAGVAPAIAQAVGLPFHREGDPEEQLVGYLRNRQLLLILDNFEHLLERDDERVGNGPTLAAAILDGAPGVRLLVTSRAALRLGHENLFPVTGMDCPQPGSRPRSARDLRRAAAFSALRLFAQSARRYDPEFVLDAANLPDVARVCNGVDGMPLGILLAASWVRMLEPGEIAAQLEAGMDLLETDLRDVPERQRSIRAVFDHSWSLLTVRERAVMQALSVFRGGFTRQAARGVTGVSLSELRTLVDRSLIQPAEGPRYEIHELLRQYAAEELAQSPVAAGTMRDRHADHFISALERWGGDLKGPRQREALHEMDGDHDNAHGAWDWAVERCDIEALTRAVEGLGLYYERRGRHREEEAVFRTAEEALAPGGVADGDAAASGTALLSMILRYRAWALYRLGRTDEAYEAIDRGLRLCDSPAFQASDTRAAQAELLWLIGRMGYRTGRREPRQALRRSLALAQSCGDAWRTARALDLLGNLEILAEDHDAGVAMVEESAAMYQELGDVVGMAETFRTVGWRMVISDRHEEGHRLIRESLRMSQDLEDPTLIAEALIADMLALTAAGRFAEGEEPLRERLAIYEEIGVRDYQGLSYLAKLAMAQGRYNEARAMTEEALRIARETDSLYGLALASGDLGRLAIVAGDYEEAMALIERSGSAYGGVGYQWNATHSRWVSAYAAWGLGESQKARSIIAEALGSMVQGWDFLLIHDMLPASALVLLDAGDVELAVEVFALARTLPYIRDNVWMNDVIGRPVAEAAASLPPEVVAAAKERGRSRDAIATCHELAEHLGS